MAACGIDIDGFVMPRRKSAKSSAAPSCQEDQYHASTGLLVSAPHAPPASPSAILRAGSARSSGGFGP